jgi:hypothetical protein
LCKIEIKQPQETESKFLLIISEIIVKLVAADSDPDPIESAPDLLFLSENIRKSYCSSDFIPKILMLSSHSRLFNTVHYHIARNNGI